MLNGNDIIKMGYPKGPLVGLALKAVRSMETDPEYQYDEYNDECYITILQGVKRSPESFFDNKELPEIINLALAWEEIYVKETSAEFNKLRDEPLPFKIFG